MNVRPNRTLLIIFYFGVSGVLLDLDHVAVLIWKNLPINLKNLSTQAGRPWHFPGLIISGIIWGICSAYLLRLYHQNKVIIKAVSQV